MTTPTRAVAYLRVSTDEQAARGHSLDVQRTKILQYAALYDIELVDIVEDPGESGKSLDRPGMKRVLAMLEDGRADAVIVSKIDRFSRDLADVNELVKKFFGGSKGSLDKSLFSVADQIDTRTANGRLVLNIKLAVAQWERETIVERTLEGMQHKRVELAKEGKSLGGPAMRALPDSTLKLIEERWFLPKDAGRWKQDDIAAFLNEQKVPTVRGGEWRLNSVQGAIKVIEQRRLERALQRDLEQQRATETDADLHI